MLAFVDTNILVYARDASEPEKRGRAAAWLEHLWRTGGGRVSAQVLTEFYVVTTRKIPAPITREDARAEVRDLAAWDPVASTPGLLTRAWDVEDRWNLSTWDALIVAAAKEAGCGVLLTEDLQHGMDLEGLVVMDPFATEISVFATL